MSRIERWTELTLESIFQRRLPRSQPPLAPERVQRILVVHKYNIGDILCSTPALRALRRAFPLAHIAILVAEHCRAVVEGNPDLSGIFTYTKAKHRSGLRAVWSLLELARVIRALRRQRFNLAIALGRPAGRSSAWLAYISGAPWRLGYSSPALRPFRFFLNLGQDSRGTALHEVDACLELLASIGIPAAGRELTLVPDPEARAAMSRRLGGVGIPNGTGRALVHISNRREASRWPPSSFVRAADLLRERLGYSILLSWSPGDATNPLFPGDDDKAEEVAGGMRTRPILLRTPTLTDLIAAVSVSDLVLSSDGGLMHIAAALDVPQVVLFGRTDTRQWAPVSRKCLVLQRDGRADRISVDEVVAAAIDLMSRWGREAASGLPSAARREGV